MSFFLKWTFHNAIIVVETIAFTTEKFTSKLCQSQLPPGGLSLFSLSCLYIHLALVGFRVYGNS